MVSSDVENATKMNKVIADWITKADDIVSRSLIDGIKITAPELEKELTDIREGKIQVKSELFMVNYSDFMERKRTQLVERVGKSDISFTTYGTFKSTIDDFEVENEIVLKVSDVTNKDWLDLFHTWLTKTRPKEMMRKNGETYKFKTLGKLKSASIDKRF